jgi:hypothetical protein
MDERRQQFKAYVGSFDAEAEAFVRGMLGDPLGMLNQTNAPRRDFDIRRQKNSRSESSSWRTGEKYDSLAPDHALQLWVAARNCSTLWFLYGIAAVGATFLIRQHSQLVGKPLGKQRPIGKTETSVVLVQKIRLPEQDGQSLVIRRVIVKLLQATRDRRAGSSGCDCGPWYCRACLLCVAHCRCARPGRRVDAADELDDDDTSGPDMIVEVGGCDPRTPK